MKQRRKHRKRKTLFSTAIITIFCAFVFWLADSLSPPRMPEEGNPIVLYSNQTRDDLRKVFQTSIKEAKKSILLIIYALTDRQIIDELKSKSESGTDVWVICDPNASPGLQRKLGSKCRVVKRFGKGLMHQKILVTDEDKIWIGSANLTGESLRIHANLVAAIHSPQIAAFVKRKATSLCEKEGLPLLHDEFQINGQKIELWFLPDDQLASKRIVGLIRSAKKTIRVAMFTWTRQDFANAIIDAMVRGVNTEVVIDRRTSQGAGSGVTEVLKKNLVPTAFNKGEGLLHHKFLYLDDSILVNGSANWTRAAFTKNDDCFMILHDLTADQRTQMQKLWDAIKLTSSEQ